MSLIYYHFVIILHEIDLNHKSQRAEILDPQVFKAKWMQNGDYLSPSCFHFHKFVSSINTINNENELQIHIFMSFS
jgi:hypothetical protein